MIPKGSFINELSDGERIKAVFMVGERRVMTARNGKPYGKLTLMDRTGEIGAMLWDNVEEQLSIIEAGSVVGVRGNVDSFNGLLQVKVDRIVLVAESEVELSDLLPSSRLGMDEMLAEILDFVASVKDRHLRQLLDALFGDEELKASFRRSPAAKGIHHNYLGGLQEHTLYMLKIIDSLLPVYAHMNLNRDLLIAGALLHDIGKIHEYTSDRVVEMTAMGRLVGHLYLSSHMADREIEKIDGFPEELRLQLLHLILAHHGELEFGSPKVPMSKEAIFLHMVDDFDAKLVGFASIIDAAPEDDDFTAYSGVYGRYLYANRYQSES